MKLDDYDEPRSSGAFQISEKPVVFGQGESSGNAPFELPRNYGAPVVFAIARDPKSLFVYWNIDWPAVFGEAAPERKVYLRIFDAENKEIQRQVVEPLTSNCDLPLDSAADSCHIEIGFFETAEEWRSVGASDTVILPSGQVGTLRPGDFALVPFHITFQRLTDLFRQSHAKKEPLTQSLARLQKRGADPEERRTFTAEENTVFRALQMGPRRIPAGVSPSTPAQTKQLQNWIERVLGFGQSSRGL